MTMGCCFSEPYHAQVFILRDAISIYMATAQPMHCIRIFLLGSQFEPLPVLWLSLLPLQP
jgi:hypothetical protein